MNHSEYAVKRAVGEVREQLAGYTQSAPIPISPVDERFTSVHEAQRELHAKLAALAERLEPVLRPQPPVDLRGAGETKSPVGGLRGSVCARLEGLTEGEGFAIGMVQGLLDRLEV